MAAIVMETPRKIARNKVNDISDLLNLTDITLVPP
jgi:hypothetical protein